MADEFHKGEVCGGKWPWNSSRNLFGCSSPCFTWNNPDMFTHTTKTRSSNGHMPDSMLPSSNRSWDQDYLSCQGGRPDENYSDILNYSHQKGLSTAFSLNNSSLLQTLFGNDALEQTLSDNPGMNYPNYQHDSDDQFVQVPPMFGIKNPHSWNTTAELPVESSTNYNPNSPTFNTKRQSESGGRMGKKSSNEQTQKRPRIETPSPLPTFKVRKEKLGDRITALQQLVSPFGKTDTASVLHEAIEYIKFLHDQVSTLCTPYLKNGLSPQPGQATDITKRRGYNIQDLRSGGLCLVPISSTFPVADAATDFWNPSFVGTFKL